MPVGTYRLLTWEAQVSDEQGRLWTVKGGQPGGLDISVSTTASTELNLLSKLHTEVKVQKQGTGFYFKCSIGTESGGDLLSLMANDGVSLPAPRLKIVNSKGHVLGFPDLLPSFGPHWNYIWQPAMHSSVPFRVIAEVRANPLKIADGKATEFSFR